MHGKPESGVLRCFHQECSERLKRSEIVQRAKFFWHADTGPGGPKVLGPKGLMPNPKSGTVTMDVTKAVNDIKAGKIEYRLDKTNIIHVPIGKASFTEEQLSDNFQAIMDAIVKAKPSSLKGAYLRSVVLTSTMGPGVKLSTAKYVG